jgi:hypothetical protein
VSGRRLLVLRLLQQPPLLPTLQQCLCLPLRLLLQSQQHWLKLLLPLRSQLLGARCQAAQSWQQYFHLLSLRLVVLMMMGLQ